MADFRYGFFLRPENKKIGLHPDEKSKTSHVSDHECKPAIMDAEGTKRAISLLPGETYVIKTKTYTEEVYSSSEEESQHSHSMKYEPVKYHGHHHDKARNQHPSLARDRPIEVDKFITNVQMEASKPKSPTYRRHPQTRVEDDINNSSHGDYNKKIANKPSGYAKQHAKHHNGYNSDNDEYDDDDDEPHKMMIRHTFGLAPLGWVRPSDDARPARGLRLSGPMNDIGKAIEYLKEAANLQSGKSVFRS